MPNSAVFLEKAGTSSVPLIARLAHTIWHQHYPSIISTEQINYMLELMYSNTSLTEQMTTGANDFFLIKNEGKDLGFISVSKIKEEENGIFIHKFYLDQTLAGKGRGTLAYNELVKLLRPSLMRLTVNRQNYKSINFYFKNGFKIESVADFDIGNGYVMNDFVMVWKAGR